MVKHLVFHPSLPVSVPLHVHCPASHHSAKRENQHVKRRRQQCLAPLGLFPLYSSLSTILERKSARTCKPRYRRMAYCEMGVLGLMWMSFRAAGCVYQLTSTVPGANSTGLCLPTINLLWSHLKLHPPRGSAAFLLPHSHSISLLCSGFILPLFFSFPQIHFDSFLNYPPTVLPPSLSILFLILHLTSSSH